MENKVLTHLDITTNSKIINGIYKYNSWDILGDRIHFEFGTDDGYIEDAVDIDEFLKNCNN